MRTDTRAALLAAAVVGSACLGSCVSAPQGPAQRSIAGVALAPALPPQPVTDTLWGVAVADPYRFTENVSDPVVAGWMRQQAQATSSILASLPGREQLLARVRQLDAAAPGLVSAVRRVEGGRLFFTRRAPGENQFKLIVRESPGGADRVLIDAEEIGRQVGRKLAILDFAPSYDGRYVAYTLQVAGSEIGELHLIDVQSGSAAVAPIDRIRFADVSWLRDGSGFFFSRLREGYERLSATERFGDRTTHFFSLKTRQAVPVFSPTRNAELKLPIYAGATIVEVPGTPLAAAFVFLGVDRNRMLFIGDLKAATEGTAQWRKVIDVADEARDIAVTRDWIYVMTARQAPRYQLARVPLTARDFSGAEVIVPAGDEVLVDIAAARDALYLTKRRGAASQLVRLPHEAPKPAQPVALPFEGTANIIATDVQQDGALVSLVGWTRTTQHFTLQPQAQAVRLVPLSLAGPGVFDAPPELTAREVMVPSHDGTLVPVSILARRDLKFDGSNPTVLYGYGAYGITQTPFFSPRLLAWIERGGVYVFAHVRGGGMLGSDWYRAGQKTTKPNTWRDGIAVAQWLISNGYTSPRRLAIYGGSAGGIFVGRSITERPELFAAAVSAVPVMDMVRAETDPNGVANIPEFGTVTNEPEFKALLAMSAYHHVKDGVRYPAILLVHGVNDTRVSVWQSTKFANRIAAASTGGPVLMRLDYELGHGGGSTLAQQQEQIVDIWSFMLWQFGDPQFQPKR